MKQYASIWYVFHLTCHENTFDVEVFVESWRSKRFSDDTDPETYNTITSLSALTRLLPPDLLVEHVSRLPSRRHRRLSQCLEEDESGEDLRLPQSPRHTDPVFVDTSLVAMKKEAPKKAVSLSDGSELWVRRVPIKKKVRIRIMSLTTLA